MSNLEPIEDADIDLKGKFIDGNEKVASPVGESENEPKPFAVAEISERQEDAMEKEKVYTKILSQVQAVAQPADDAAVATDAQIVSEPEGVEAKIETLIKLATTKGVVHAVQVARHMDDNYALDEFHDRLLAEELHDALTKSGLIKEI